MFYSLVVVHLRATGDTPILKQAKFKVSSSSPALSWVLFNTLFDSKFDVVWSRVDPV